MDQCDGRGLVRKGIADCAKDANAPTMEDAVRHALGEDYAYADEGFRVFVDAHVDVAW